ncbi:MAG: type II secretion system F family protein [Pirellulaceae bacterium]
MRRRPSAEHVAASLTQLSDLLQNGVPLLGSLKLLAEESANPVLGEIMQQVHDDVSEGVALEDAMAKHPKTFSDLTISMVRAGSEGAFLEEALSRVAGFLELQEELKGKVKGAMAYPSFLMVGGIAVTLLLVVFFVPKFEGLFDRLERQGTGLPVATHVLLGASDFLLKYGVFVIAGVVGAIYGLRKLWLTDQGKHFADKWLLKLPIVGGVLHDSAVSRFCRVLGTLLTNGVPILRALEISSGSVGNSLLEKAILDSADNISAGETLSAPLAKSGLIPPSVMAMIRIAEESNSLDRVLVNVANTIDTKMDRKLNLMVRLIEPVMLVIIGCAILFVLVALLLPVFDMSASV